VVGRAARADDGGVLEPTTVWMVELRTRSTLRDVKGVLTLEQDGLSFHSPADGTEVRIPFAAARSAKRLRMSPVLLVRWQDAGDRLTAFYFAPPPPLVQVSDATTETRAGFLGVMGSRPPSKRKHRRTNATYLTSQNGSLKPTLVAWVKEVRVRISSAGG
jgi:hypothetical protein